MATGLNPSINAANADALKYPKRYLRIKSFNQLDPDFPFKIEPFPFQAFRIDAIEDKKEPLGYSPPNNG